GVLGHVLVENALGEGVRGDEDERCAHGVLLSVTVRLQPNLRLPSGRVVPRKWDSGVASTQPRHRGRRIIAAGGAESPPTRRSCRRGGAGREPGGHQAARPESPPLAPATASPRLPTGRRHRDGTGVGQRPGRVRQDDGSGGVGRHPPGAARVAVVGRGRQRPDPVLAVRRGGHRACLPGGIAANRAVAAGGELALNSLVTSLINVVAETGRRVTVVIDGYDVIASPVVDATLGHLLSHRPSDLAVVLTTRSDSALPIARLRLDGELAEIGTADLRFRPEEVEEFLRSLPAAP